jgi:hypothetical protein
MFGIWNTTVLGCKHIFEPTVSIALWFITGETNKVQLFLSAGVHFSYKRLFAITFHATMTLQYDWTQYL